ncbi:hypothetical protein [Confluentibacter citreus]|uniref:hypothetical protein n=1 Tax=Confluentibacter citreus TaxID=2007307 RepID=UPI000C2902D4|nr:hypothetical protein [Confluentibacter citreus]
MNEQEFITLYTNRLQNIIQSYFSKLEITQRDYPEHLQSQIDNYEAEIKSIANILVTDIVLENNINLQDMFKSNSHPYYLLSKLILKSWSLQPSVMQSYTDFCNTLK